MKWALVASAAIALTGCGSSKVPAKATEPAASGSSAPIAVAPSLADVGGDTSSRENRLIAQRNFECSARLLIVSSSSAGIAREPLHISQ